MLSLSPSGEGSTTRCSLHYLVCDLCVLGEGVEGVSDGCAASGWGGSTPIQPAGSNGSAGSLTWWWRRRRHRASRLARGRAPATTRAATWSPRSTCAPALCGPCVPVRVSLPAPPPKSIDAPHHPHPSHQPPPNLTHTSHTPTLSSSCSLVNTSIRSSTTAGVAFARALGAPSPSPPQPAPPCFVGGVGPSQLSRVRVHVCVAAWGQPAHTRVMCVCLCLGVQHSVVVGLPPNPIQPYQRRTHIPAGRGAACRCSWLVVGWCPGRRPIQGRQPVCVWVDGSIEGSSGFECIIPCGGVPAPPRPRPQPRSQHPHTTPIRWTDRFDCIAECACVIDWVDWLGWVGRGRTQLHTTHAWDGRLECC